MIAVVVSVVLGTEDFKYIKPLFHLALFSYFWLSTKKFSPQLFLFLGSTMIAEYLAATNFIEYFDYITTLFGIYFATGVYIIYPVLKRTKPKFVGVDRIAMILVILILIYIILTIFLISIEEVKDYILFGIATVVFSTFIGCCLFITAFHKNPKKVYLFVVGVGYVVICAGSLIYELQFDSVLLLGLVNLSEVIAQVSFVSFLIGKDELLQDESWYL